MAIAIVSGFAVENAQAGDPIPGVDVSLEQVPGGVKGQVNTGKNGTFAFSQLKPGRYLLRITPPSLRAEDFNSSRSNLSNLVGSGGIEVHAVSIELIKVKHLKSASYPPVPIVISASQGGKITGQVTRHSAVAVKEKGVIRRSR